MHLIQIFLPLSDDTGQRFQRDEYESVEQTLISQFNGFTAYRRAPAKGLWRSPSSEVQEDELIIYEVMAETVDRAWWTDYRKSLEQQFKQQEVLIRAQSIEIL
jgi:hypothetical protein